MGMVREILSSPATVISVVELATTAPVTLVPSRIRSVARGRFDEEAVSLVRSPHYLWSAIIRFYRYAVAQSHFGGGVTTAAIFRIIPSDLLST